MEWIDGDAAFGLFGKYTKIHLKCVSDLLVASVLPDVNCVFYSAALCKVPAAKYCINIIID